MVEPGTITMFVSPSGKPGAQMQTGLTFHSHSTPNQETESCQ